MSNVSVIRRRLLACAAALRRRSRRGPTPRPPTTGSAPGPEPGPEALGLHRAPHHPDRTVRHRHRRRVRPSGRRTAVHRGHRTRKSTSKHVSRTPPSAGRGPLARAHQAGGESPLTPDGTARMQVTGPDARPGTARMSRSAAPCLDTMDRTGRVYQPRQRHSPRNRGATAIEPDGSARGSACGPKDAGRQELRIGPNRQTRCRERGYLPVLAGQSEARSSTSDRTRTSRRSTAATRCGSGIRLPDGTLSRWAVALARRRFAHELSRAEPPCRPTSCSHRYRSRCLDRWRPALATVPDGPEAP